MIYVVHSIGKRQIRQTFDTYGSAFTAFKDAVKEGKQAALWYGSAFGFWTRLYASEYYPPKLTEPYKHD